MKVIRENHITGPDYLAVELFTSEGKVHFDFTLCFDSKVYWTLIEDNLVSNSVGETVMALDYYKILNKFHQAMQDGMGGVLESIHSSEEIEYILDRGARTLDDLTNDIDGLTKSLPLNVKGCTQFKMASLEFLEINRTGLDYSFTKNSLDKLRQDLHIITIDGLTNGLILEF